MTAMGSTSECAASELFANEEAQHVGLAGSFATSRSIPGGEHAQGGQCGVLNVEHTQDGRAGGRNAFHGRAGRVDGSIAEKRDRGRRGHGHRAVRATHGAASNVELRRHPAIDAKRRGACGCANDVHDGVDRADLVKVDLLNGNGMNAGFGFAEQLKGARSAVLHHLGKRSGTDDAKNGRERTMMRVLLIVRVRAFMGMRMRMRLFVVGVFFVRANAMRLVRRF